MAGNDSSDHDFDQEMERILQEHFDQEGSNLRAPGDPWEWLESRMDEPPAPSLFSRWLSVLPPVRQGLLSPAIAVAGVAIVAVAVAATLWAFSGNGGGESPRGLAVAPSAQTPASQRLATAAPAPTSITQFTTAREDRGPAASQGEPAPTRAASSARAPAATVAPAAAPAPTTLPATMMEEETAYPAPAATAAQAARPTAVPAPESTAVPMAETAPESTPAAQPTGAPSSRSQPAATAAPTPAPTPAPRREETGEQGQPSATTFRDYGRQPFIETDIDNVSTFSLDTDRTSFQLALGWARSGYEVNPDSVRAEEWLNAFDYQYGPPSNNSEFAIVSNLYPHPLDESKQLARIAFQAPELVDDRPLNVTLVLDASGSMADGNRVDIAREAAESIRRSLHSQDSIAVVHFTDDVIRHYTVGHSAPDAFQVANSIAQLQPHGSTNVQAGLDLGISMAGQARDLRPDAYNYIILMSDGVANVDATDPFAILETAYDADTRNPLRLITIGVGINNYNDLLLEQLAQHGNGWYRYLDSTEQARATFSRDNWLALSIPFADQTRAQVTWDSGVVDQWRIIGYENRVTPDHTFTQDRKEFAELYSGAATTVLYEVELTESARSRSRVSLGRVELRWVAPGTGESRSQSAALTGRPHGGFEGSGGSLAHFGAIAALSADLYGILPGAPEAAYSEVHTGLNDLLEQLRSLRGDLGMLEAYEDLLFLLEHITFNVADLVPIFTGSGYSR